MKSVSTIAKSARGTKSPVSVSDEKKIAFIFSICIYDLPQNNRLLTSDIHYL